MAAARLVGYAHVILAVSCLLFACARQKLRLPVEEIQRPLSMPPKNWNVGLGVGPGCVDHNNATDFYVDGRLDFIYPYLPISERAELHFTLLNLKYYLIRNTEIRDSTIVCTGPNWVLGGGLTGISFSSVSGFSASFDLFTEFKLPFNDKVWMMSSCWMNYTPIRGSETYQEKDRVDINGGMGIGYQWNQRLYSTITISGQYHRLQYSSTFEGPFWILTYSDIWDERQLNVYSYTGYNINKRWKIYARPALGFHSNGALTGSMVSGFVYYW